MNQPFTGPVADRARAFAPGSVGNVGPGLDVLGLAVAGAGDTVLAERRPEPGVVVLESGHPNLPTDPERHAAAIAAHAVLRRVGADRAVGLALRVRKELPLAGGQGGSAASAAAGAGAANALLGDPLPREALVEAALESETQLAGRHADNVAASVLGGLALVRSLDPLDLVTLPPPRGLWVVLVRPHMTLRTAEGRAVLPAAVSREVVVHQSAQVAAIVAAAWLGDLALLGRAIDDRVAEPARTALLPGFAEAKQAAQAAGALGCSISGSGPTAFAFADDPARAEAIGSAMLAAYRRRGLAADVRITEPDPVGLRSSRE
jgi:homoserine kinase